MSEEDNSTEGFATVRMALGHIRGLGYWLMIGVAGLNLPPLPEQVIPG